jgi:hypothetical protein
MPQFLCLFFFSLFKLCIVIWLLQLKPNKWTLVTILFYKTALTYSRPWRSIIRTEIPVENTLKDWKYCRYNPNICYHFWFLWLIMEFTLDKTLKFIVSTLKINWICIHHSQNWQCSRGDHIILELRPSIFCPPI